MNEHRLVAVGTGRILAAVVLVAGGLAPLASRAAVPALFVGVLLIGCFYLVDRRRPPAPPRLLIVGFAALLAWSALSALWADSKVSPAVPAELAGLLIAGSLLIAWAGARDQERLGGALELSLEIALGLYAFEFVSGDWLTRQVHGFAWRDILDSEGGIAVAAYLINGTAILIMLLWPCLHRLTARGQRLRAALLAGGVALASLVFGHTAEVVALGTGAIAWGLWIWQRGRAARGLAILFAVFMLGSPFAIRAALEPLDLQEVTSSPITAKLDNSSVVRLFIWRFVTERIIERPLLGWGLDAARRLPGGGEKFTFLGSDMNSDRRVPVSEYYLPLHPHNQILQIWLELGFGGALIVAAIGFLLIWRLRGPAPLAVTASILTFDYLSFGVWQSWWIAAVFIACAQTAAVAASEGDDKETAGAAGRIAI